MAGNDVRHGIKRYGEKGFAFKQIKNRANCIHFCGEAAGCRFGKQVIDPASAFCDGEAGSFGFSSVYTVVHGKRGFNAKRERNRVCTFIDGLRAGTVKLDLCARCIKRAVERHRFRKGRFAFKKLDWSIGFAVVENHHEGDAEIKHSHI